MSKIDLKAYYATTHWKNLSRKTREQRQQCELCGTKENLHVHHLRYRFFREEDQDLQVACKQCHLKTIHKHLDQDDMIDLNHRTKPAPEPATIDHAFQIEENRIARRNRVRQEVDYRFLWANLDQLGLTTRPLNQFTREEVSILVECCIDAIQPAHPNHQTIWGEK